MNIFAEIGLLTLWCIWCGVLAHTLDQPGPSDSIASLLGMLVILFAVVSR